ncbi:cystatin-9-like isoform X2 [Talpa occidentalis]|uniref:cystatin-9-like isoform X2 n=1 Tax=Talpa occidentalis TaxID=50954 RepID=UPI0023F90A10|nr:cystatin-9-like isoform X2 [Talpa occidentalis]
MIGPVPRARLGREPELGRTEAVGARLLAAEAMRCQPWRWALPWEVLLLLLGPQAQSYSWHLHEGSDCDEGSFIKHYFPATVEYALHMFNEKSKDTNAYRLVHILNSWREQSGRGATETWGCR